MCLMQLLLSCLRMLCLFLEQMIHLLRVDCLRLRPRLTWWNSSIKAHFSSTHSNDSSDDRYVSRHREVTRMNLDGRGQCMHKGKGGKCSWATLKPKDKRAVLLTK
ncbi:hypothetical protein BD324DRAFT_638067 [Kockovaella imperatae]|uniref:Secreted protein n=1 Tax=Kockovaella imperatae TaxID=4999 RepID=A0A1Y1U7N0_9TREE|nr:hypothetical protein BD324DRAFT_638067 [Kockovaella imperatae]ORX34023.1 hypothetical protein BD324DRAFT_638067 [Kockovaella imperatae]